jgi:nicotinamidase-related amidase
MTLEETPMTVTTLDPTTALIVVDLQKGIVSVPTVTPIDGVVQNAAALAAAFRRHGLPVVLVTVEGGAPGRTETPSPAAGVTRPSSWADLVPELDQQSTDLTVVKRTWGAFTGTDLDRRLKSLGVTQVVVTGIATSAGVESTARHAHENGYHVTIATDAMTDRNAESHHNSLTRIFPRIGETGTTAEIISLLDSRG